MAIVTISCEMGSGGSEIGTQLAERLGYRLADQDVIAKAAQQYGVLEERLTQLDERTPGLLARFDGEVRQYLTVLQCAVLDVAEADDVVIMGRSAQILLRGITHALRVFVRAPLEVRVARVIQKLTVQMQEPVDARTAANLVRRSDQQKVGRMRYLFDVDWRDPKLYDLVLDTATITLDAGVDLLFAVAERPEFAASEASRRAVWDRALAARVQVALAADPGIRKHRIAVEAHQGVITLEGTGGLEAGAQVARTVSGVVALTLRHLESPFIQPFMT
jgi:cytidylate kinase